MFIFAKPFFFAFLTTAAIFFAGVPCAADDKSSDVGGPTKVEWEALNSLFNAGKYSEAAAEADAIVTAVRPKKKAPDFLPRSVETIDALMRRGFAELELGHLDAAEATFVEADTILADREFKKLVATWERAVGLSEANSSIDLELRPVELSVVRSAVVLERLRRIAAQQPPAGDAAKQPSATALDEVQKSIAGIEGFLIAAADARKKLSNRLEEWEEAANAPPPSRTGREPPGQSKPAKPPTIGPSPHKRALMSSFYPDLIVGITAYELSRLGFTVPQVVDPENSSKTEVNPTLRSLENLGSSELHARALAHFDAASKALDQVIQEALPKGVAAGNAAQRREAGVLSIQLHLARCAAILRAGNLVDARKEVDEVLKLRTEMEKTTKSARPEPHPDLFLPLLLAAEISALEADALARAGKADEARIIAARAAEELARANDLPLAADHPRRKGLPRIATILESQRARAESTVATSDAAEIAAQRLRRALESTAPVSAGF